jgi:hypothetical protein
MQYYVTAQAEETEDTPQAEYTVVFRRDLDVTISAENTESWSDTYPVQLSVSVEVDVGATREQIIEAAIAAFADGNCDGFGWESKYDVRDVVTEALNKNDPTAEEVDTVFQR